LRRLHRFQPSEELLQRVSGRTFRNLLWPVRGGRLRSASRARMVVDATEAPLRAGADGLVVYSQGHTIALLHPMGWVTTYEGIARSQVVVGQQVERGAWIARGDSRVQITLHIAGRRVNPTAHVVRMPD
ncbi:MAG TPA: M23 family metallopeptidase, partial [Polyangiaceae bacterium]|nr:M23 family metallopeptidase [Polyangiaceae bacterium]